MRFTLEQYQQLEAISKDNTLNDLDKSLFSICTMYGLTEEQLDSYNPKKVLKMADKINKLFAKPLQFVKPKYISTFRINYIIEKITLGQYVELVYFTKSNDILNKAQYIVASMAKTFYKTEHIKKANCFLQCDAINVWSAAIHIKSNFDTFNTTKFKNLFEPYSEMVNDNSSMSNWFNTNYGWFFSAKSVADYEGITLEQAYKLPVVQALNDLVFLKARSRYDYYLAHKNK